jgi:predicted permease
MAGDKGEIFRPRHDHYHAEDEDSRGRGDRSKVLCEYSSCSGQLSDGRKKYSRGGTDLNGLLPDHVRLFLAHIDMSSLVSDLRHALRSLARAPYVTIVAVLSIGLGVGGATAVFSWMDGMVLHPFPTAFEQGRLVGIEVGEPNGGMGAWSYQTFKELRDGLHILTGVGAFRLFRVAVRSPSEDASAALIATTVSGKYFDVLGVKPILGRSITDAEVDASLPVAVLGYRYWMDRFLGDRNVLGRVLLLNGDAYTIVGVAPPSFAGVYLGVVPHLYVPLTLQPRLSGVNALIDRKMRTWLIFGRLKPGVTIEQAQSDADATAKRIGATYGDRPAPGAEVIPLRTQFLGKTLEPLLTAMLAVTILLVVLAAANVASLLIVRAGARQGEIAVRLAMGASRMHLVQSAVMESAALALVGSAAGVGVAYLARGALYAFIPQGSLPVTLAVPLSGRVLLLALAAAVVVTIGCGLAPAIAGLRVAPQRALRAGSRALIGGGTRLRSAIVAGQLAFCVIFLVLSGMFVRGLEAASSVDVGFSDPEHVLLVGTNLRFARVNDSTGVVDIDRILRELRGAAGVRSASVATMIPLGFGGVDVADLKVEGYAPAPNEDMTAERSLIGSDYASTMRIRVVRGRDFADADRAGSLPVALVNETFARRFFPRGDALGRRFDIGRGWETIVGVLHSGKYNRLDEKPQPVFYLPILQSFYPTFTVHVRTAGDPRQFTETVRKTLTGVNVDLPSLQPRTLAEHVAAATFTQRTGAQVLGAFAVLAVVLSIIGLYGALAFSVVLRQRELAIRSAMGARNGAMIWTVARQALTIALWGVGVGAVLALVGGQLLRSQVSGVAAGDPLLYIGAAGVLLAAAAVSAWIPARRALRLDPAVLLRGE